MRGKNISAEDLTAKKELALEVIRRLKAEYPDAGCTLDYDHAWQLLVSVRLAGASWRTELTPVAEVVGRERRLPAEFIADSGLDVTAAFREYAAPLVAPLPAEPVVWVG